MSPADRYRVGVQLGLLPKFEGSKHKACGTKITLKDVTSSKAEGLSLEGFGKLDPVPKLCKYSCASRSCSGIKNGIPNESEKDAKIHLGGRGRATAGEGLLVVCLACQPLSQKYSSVLGWGPSYRVLAFY